METERLRAVQLRGICVGAVAVVAALALTVAAGSAKAASPLLEFVPSGGAFPISFTAAGGPVTAELDGFEPVVHCTGSEGEGRILGPRSTESRYVFTGCAAQGGTENGHPCKSEGAQSGEIQAEEIKADLVYIDQATHQVGMLLNPSGGVYMNFECGGEPVRALGPFLSPVGPINTETSSFTASLSASNAMQTPTEYENDLGEKRQAIPMGERGSNPLARTGVQLSFTINPIVPLQIRAVTAAEIEAKQREDEAAAAKKRQDEEAAASAATKKRQDEEAAAAAAAKKRQEDEAAAKLRQEEERARLRRQHRATALKQCRKASSKHQRTRCETRVKKKYGGNAARKD